MNNYYENDDFNEYETYTDKGWKKELCKKNNEFYKSETYLRFFL